MTNSSSNSAKHDTDLHTLHAEQAAIQSTQPLSSSTNTQNRKRSHWGKKSNTLLY